MHTCHHHTHTHTVREVGEHSQEGGGYLKVGKKLRSVFAMSRRVEIDTAAPFSSVKEAVVLFGERILAGEIYAARFNQMKDLENKKESACTTKLEVARIELEETKQYLEKAREEALEMENHLVSLQQKLDMARRELEELEKKKKKKVDGGCCQEADQHVDSLVEMAKEIVVESSMGGANEGAATPNDVQRKGSSVRFVTSLPTITASSDESGSTSTIDKQFSTTTTTTTTKVKKKKGKRMQLVALFGGLLPKRKEW